MKAHFFFLFFFISSSLLFAQQSQKLQNNLKVIIDGDTMPNPWAGGMNAPRFAHVDFDKDGLPDLMVFDREDNSFTPFINTGSPGVISFEYAPEYEEAFVECNCTDWALTADYDCDGKMDVFCGANSYVDVYRQVEKNGKPFFLPVVHQLPSVSFGGFSGPILSTFDDLPAVLDLDEDGDIDFLNWNLFANVLTFHRNYAMENLGRCDTFLLEEEAPCWGHFAEVAANQIKLNDTTVWLCPLGNFSPTQECASMMRRSGRIGRTPGGMRHIGSTTLILDLNGDGLKDLLTGDVSFNFVNGVYNCGRPDYAYMDSVDTSFPVYDTPINMGMFPAMFYVDVDNDGHRDLVVAPNTTKNAENKFSTQLYANQGIDTHPDFEYEGRGFLQEHSIDQGSATSPVFFDYNQDGLLDLLVGDAGIFDTVTRTAESRLLLYQNVGDFDVPIYELVDDDYLNLSAETLKARYVPTVGDLDGDGDADLLVGMANGKIMHFENTAASGMTASYSLVDSTFSNIDVGGNAAPFLVDLNQDAALDLFVGSYNGKIAYHVNQGTALNFNFLQVTDEFGFIQIREAIGGQLTGNTRPVVFDYDNDNELEMLIGTINGDVEVFENLTQGFMDTLRRSTYLFNYDFGNNAAPAAAIIDSTGDFTYVVGVGRGGLKLFNSLPDILKTPVSIDKPDLAAMGIRFFPNPAQDKLWIEIDRQFSQETQATLLTTHGQVISRRKLGMGENFISLAGLAQGMYLLQFEVDGQLIVEKLVKQ